MGDWIVSKSKWKIPNDILIPFAAQVMRETGKGTDTFITYDFERVHELCGYEYAHIPLDDVKNQVTNLRKKGSLGAVNGGHGASKRRPISKEMKAYYLTDHWKEFMRKIREFWGHRCAMCNSSERLDGHHRTYERLWHEEMTDVIPLCRKCHKVADVRRQREAGRNMEPDLFNRGSP
jgi:hypothetical protein